jgi:elongation factor G
MVLERGPVAGCEVVDVRCEVFDGKMHPVDSKDIAFQMAGRSLMRDLVLQAKPILLEPIMKLKVTVPEDAMGDVMGDISGKRGRVQGMGAEGGRQVVEALVPLAELLVYEAQLKSLTGGRGTFHVEFDHYDQVPANLQEKIAADAKTTTHAEEEG